MKTILIFIGVLIAINLAFAGFSFIGAYLKANLLKQVEFTVSLNKGSMKGNEYYYLNLKAPFYDEEKHFYLGFLPIQISFIPIETVPSVLKQLLKEKYLLQTEWDCAVPYEHSQISEALKENKIEAIKGLFIYSPEAISLGALTKLGFTDGKDVFFIINQKLPDDKIRDFENKLSEWSKISPRDAILAEREWLQSEGEIVKAVDVWQIIHRDEDFIRKAINLVFERVGEKAIKKAGLKVSFSSHVDFASHVFSAPRGSAQAVKVFIKGNKMIFQGRGFKEVIDLK
ncbi:MAG: hypothetical protein A2351_06320 [Omnitrophica bacterium RIFOXYB12_FULL_50_7]|nr:MAG: hypothetical protein A2351_06320 [Omnitrophica bacterium RIFOXYB12_FULL_50_7]